MSDQPYDWEQFKRKVFISAEVSQVFQAWAVPEKIIEWFIAEAEYTLPDGKLRPASEIVRAGDQYRWRWHQGLESTGQVLEVVENEKLSFTFGSKEPGSDEKIVVTITTRRLEDTTVLELTQGNMAVTPEAQVGWHMQCNLGWSFFMTNLKAWLEHGVDLRETDPERAYASRAVTL